MTVDEYGGGASSGHVWAPAGTRVIVLASLGRRPAEAERWAQVPPVIGATQDEAVASLQRAGFMPQIVANPSAVAPAGEVVDQWPPARETVAADSQAVLLVSSGPLGGDAPAVAVPNTAGLSELDAGERLQAAGLHAQLVRDYHPTVPAGLVVAQLPASVEEPLPAPAPTPEPGHKPRAWIWAVAAVVAAAVIAVILFAALGGSPVTVPDVTGKTQADAEAAIKAAGLTVGSVKTAQSTTVEPGSVISQDPAAGAEASEGDAVGLTVSAGQALIDVPDLTGMTQTAAENQLKAAGLVPQVAPQASATVPQGNVISQAPAAGSKVPEGTSVAVVVSSGPETKTVVVPDVVGDTQAEAEAALTDAGLVAEVIENYDSTVPAGQVVSQLPLAGDTVAQGTTVGIVVSKGPAPSPATAAVPDVVGKQQADAEAALADAGFTPVTLALAGTGKPAGEIAAQLPAAGSQLEEGGSVLLVVATGT